MANVDFYDDADTCPNCGGEGVIYMCEDEIGCIDPESGCDLCERRCDWCRPLRRALPLDDPQEAGNGPDHPEEGR